MIRVFFPLVCVICIFSGCSRAEPSRSAFTLGTLCTVTLYEKGTDRVYRDIFSRLAEIENQMSVHIKESEVSALNAAAGIGPVKVGDEVFGVIERALYYAALSEGALDPTVEPLVSLWGIGSDNPRVPAQEEIDAVLPLVNWRDVELDWINRTVFLRKPGMALDLGAIAKGYAADEAAAIIRKARIPRAIIDLGGNILVLGEKQDGSPWRVGVQDPGAGRGAYIGITGVKEKTVVTSGVYERFFENQGNVYHHIFSVSDGYPVRNGLLSVTIIAGSSMDADALSTAVFALGYEKGRALVESLNDVACIFVFDDQSIRVSRGADFTLSDDNYRIIED